MKRLIRIVIATLVLVAIGIALKFTVFRTNPVPVTVQPVERGRVEKIVVNSKAGTIRSRQRAQLSPAVSGRVIELTIRRGDVVHKGQLLLRLDDSEYRAQVLQAERALAAARAAEKQSSLEAAQAGRELDRNRALASDSAIAPSAFEAIESRRHVALAGVEGARERARQAGASLQAAQASFEKTMIHAPFDGVVADLSTELGEWLSPSPPGVNIPAVIDLVDLDSIYVSAPLDEVDLARVHVGLPVRISVDAFGDSAFEGTITSIAPYVLDKLEQNRTFEIEADFGASTSAADRPRDFVPGATADVEIILDSRDDVLRVPTYAILEGGKVLVIRDGMLVGVPVERGISNWQYTEITGGLREGENVVISLDRAEVKEGAAAVISGEKAP
ncbi:MAG: efflux RND transporter periplasmic adaptor subunit [Candidatus Hydrogenedentota bacterium]